MDRRIKLFWIAVAVLALLFYALPQTLFYIAENKIKSGDRSREIEKNTPPAKEFYSGIRLMKYVGYFPGFGKKSKEFIVTFVGSNYANYSIDEQNIKFHNCEIRLDAARDSLRRTLNPQTKAEWDIYNVKNDSIYDWLSDHGGAMTKTQADSFCTRWADFTAILAEVDYSFPKMEECK